MTAPAAAASGWSGGPPPVVEHDEDAPHVPGRNVEGLNTKAGKQREKAARKAAEQAAKQRRKGES